MKLIFGIFLLVLCLGQVHAQKCKVDSGYRGSRFHLPNEQQHLVKFFKDIEEIPKNVRNNLYSYLSNKLGERFSKRLKFSEGYYLNLAQLKKEFPELYEKSLKLGAYDLIFYFSDKANGLKSYYTKVALNEDGSINAEINLPDIAANPLQAKIISCKTASMIAKKNNFPKEFQSMEFQYSAEQKSFVWTVTDNRETTPDVSGSGDMMQLVLIGHTFNMIDINANDGSIIRKYKDGFVL